MSSISKKFLFNTKKHLHFCDNTNERSCGLKSLLLLSLFCNFLIISHVFNNNNNNNNKLLYKLIVSKILRHLINKTFFYYAK